MKEAVREILALRPSREMRKQIEELLKKNRREGLSEAEERIWASYELVEHLVRVARAKASATKIEERKIKD